MMLAQHARGRRERQSLERAKLAVLDSRAGAAPDAPGLVGLPARPFAVPADILDYDAFEDAIRALG